MLTTPKSSSAPLRSGTKVLAYDLYRASGKSISDAVAEAMLRVM